MVTRNKVRLFVMMTVLCMSLYPGHAEAYVHIALTTDTITWRRPVIDTGQVDLYDRSLGLTVYLQQKNVHLRFRSLHDRPTLSYVPNRTVNLGLGFIYRYLVLTGSFSIIPEQPKERVHTRSFDFQSQLLSPRIVSFLYSQYYKGVYNNQSFLAPSPGHPVYVRPDISMLLLGASTSYGIRKDFSFSGNIAPTQWQKRSGGSPLVALDVFVSILRGDSALVPTALAADYPYANVWRNRTWSIGPGVGYAYTQIVRKHFFLTGMLNARVPLQFTLRQFEDGSEQHVFGLGLHLGLWARAGYNTDRWNVALTYTNNRATISGSLTDPDMLVNSGYCRLAYTRRLHINHKTRKQLKPVDDLMDIPFELIDQIVP